MFIVYIFILQGQIYQEEEIIPYLGNIIQNSQLVKHFRLNKIQELFSFHLESLLQT